MVEIIVTDSGFHIVFTYFAKSTLQLDAVYYDLFEPNESMTSNSMKNFATQPMFVILTWNVLPQARCYPRNHSLRLAQISIDNFCFFPTLITLLP